MLDAGIRERAEAVHESYLATDRGFAPVTLAFRMRRRLVSKVSPHVVILRSLHAIGHGKEFLEPRSNI